MSRVVTIVGAMLVGGVIAVLASWGIVSAQTAAPATNPASVNVVQYGSN